MIILVAALMLGAAPSNRPNEEKNFHSTAVIRQHLRGMVASLRDTDVSTLSPALQARRGFLIERLAVYAERGVFPHNHVLPYQNPIFLDEHGTACAVGQLIIDSGHRDLAERVRAKDNTGYLLELDVEGLADWVATSGFTPMELATIQPSYGPARSDDTWIVETDLKGENPRTIKVARRPWWGASNSEVASAVHFGGKVFLVDQAGFGGATDGVIRRVDEEGLAVERETSSRGLRVADGKLFSLEDDGVWVRGEAGPWSQLAVVKGATMFQVRSATDLWVLNDSGDVVTFSHFDGAQLAPFVTMPRGAGVTDFYATTDGRVFFVSDGVSVISKRPVTSVVPAGNSVFGAGDQVFAIGGTAVFKLNVNDTVEQLFDGLTTLGGLPSQGVVLRDGRLAVVGPQGSLMLRSTTGEWQAKSLGQTKARFVGIAEGPTGLLITVDGSQCATKDWLCEDRPMSGCSAVGGSSLLSLLFAVLVVRRTRRHHSRR